MSTVETNTAINPLASKQFNGDWSTPCWQCYGTTGGNSHLNHLCQCCCATPGCALPCLSGCWGPGAIVARSDLSGPADKMTGAVCCPGPCNVAGVVHCGVNCILQGFGIALCGVGLCIPAIHTTVVATQYRSKHKIAGNPVYDFLCSLCCIGCFTGQVLREIELREGLTSDATAHPKDDVYAPPPAADHQPTWTATTTAYPAQTTNYGEPAFVPSGPVQM